MDGKKTYRTFYTDKMPYKTGEEVELFDEFIESKLDQFIERVGGTVTRRYVTCTAQSETGWPNARAWIELPDGTVRRAWFATGCYWRWAQ